MIVPYRAQSRTSHRTAHQGARRQRRTAERIGTVDAFQGGEKDLIVYGFTRSNTRGDIGFLRELRRLNVAITRARRQLILVGDSATLRQAGDKPFAELLESMTSYLRSHGDIRPSREVAAQLAVLARSRS